MTNDFRRLKIVSQPLADQYTIEQCYELKLALPEIQAMFLFYMMVKLIRSEGYIDEKNLGEILHQYQDVVHRDQLSEQLHRIYKQSLRDGFLTMQQIVGSATSFFLEEVSADPQDLSGHGSICSPI